MRDLTLDAQGFDAGRALPEALAQAAVRREITRHLRRIALARPRRDPLTVPSERQHAHDVTFVAGGLRDGLPVAVWRYAVTWSRDRSVAPIRGDLADRSLLIAAATASGDAYYAFYPPEVGPVRDASEASTLAAEDGVLQAERERVLSGYRQRRDATPKRWRVHFELAMVSAGLDLDLLPRHGPFDEAMAAAREAENRATKQAKVHALLGWLFERMGDHAVAADAYGRASTLASRNLLFAYAWADNSVFAGRDEEAREAFEEAHRRARATRGQTLEPGRHRRATVDRLEAWIIDQCQKIRSTHEDLAGFTDDEILTEQQSLLTIDPTRIPPQFRDLIPLAEAWGIGDDALRSDAVERATPADKNAILATLEGRRQALNDWLDRFDDTDLAPEAAAFMTFLLACEEMGI